MELTSELAATAAQVIPVFAVGGLVFYAAQVRNHNEFLQPYIDRILHNVDAFLELHSKGIRGYELVSESRKIIASESQQHLVLWVTDWWFRVYGIVIALTVILANALAFVLSLMRLANVEMPKWTGSYVVVSMIVGFAATALLPLSSNSGGMLALIKVAQTPRFRRAKTLLREAQSEMTPEQRQADEQARAELRERSTKGRSIPPVSSPDAAESPTAPEQDGAP